VRGHHCDAEGEEHAAQHIRAARERGDEREGDERDPSEQGRAGHRGAEGDDRGPGAARRDDLGTADRGRELGGVVLEQALVGAEADELGRIVLLGHARTLPPPLDRHRGRG
jgi:hypothetical protein